MLSCASCGRLQSMEMQPRRASQEGRRRKRKRKRTTQQITTNTHTSLSSIQFKITQYVWMLDTQARVVRLFSIAVTFFFFFLHVFSCHFLNWKSNKTASIQIKWMCGHLMRSVRIIHQSWVSSSTLAGSTLQWLCVQLGGVRSGWKKGGGERGSPLRVSPSGVKSPHPFLRHINTGFVGLVPTSTS